MTLNQLLVNKKASLYIPFKANDQQTVSTDLVRAFLLEMKGYGFIPSLDLAKYISRLNEKDFVSVYKDVITSLKKCVGADVKIRTLFPNFPQGVTEISESELFTTQFLHYIGNFLRHVTGDESYVDQFSPTMSVEEVEKHSKEEFNLRPLSMITVEGIAEVVNNLLESKVSISDSDRELITLFFDLDASLISPNTIPFKENLIFFVNLSLNKQNTDALFHTLKTPTDVLRFAVAISDGDVTLADYKNAKVCVFKKFSTKEKNLIIKLLNNTKGGIDDVHKHKPLFRALFKMISFGKKKSVKFPQTRFLSEVAFDRVDYTTYNGKIEALLEKSVVDSLPELKKRPGDFLRRLNRLISNTENHEELAAIIDAFKDVVDDMQTPALLSLSKFLDNRNKGLNRFYFARGNAGNISLIPKFDDSVEEWVISDLISTIHTSLEKRFSILPSLGYVVLDEKLKEFKLPMSQRSSSSSLLPLTRGSSIDLEGKEAIRMFCYWVGEDIDLSAVYYDEQGELVGHVAYTNLGQKDNNGKLVSYHSGDVTYAPDGAHEFIDIDIEGMKKIGARYIACSINVFNGPCISKHKEISAGWMELNEVKQGGAFKAQAVKNNFQLTASSRSAVPFVVDLHEGKIYWTDASLAISAQQKSGNAVYKQTRNILDFINLFVKENNIPTVYELLYIHAKARGKVISKEEAETLQKEYEKASSAATEGEKEIEKPLITNWTVESNIQFDLDTIMGKLLQ